MHSTRTFRALGLAAAVALSALCSSAMADAYVGGSLGSSHLSLDCTGTTTCDNTGSAYKFIGGYRFGNGFAGELGFHDFGKATATVSGVDLTAKATAITLAAAYQANLSDDWGLVGRLGVASVRAKISGALGGVSSSVKDTKTNAYFGLGVNYKLTSDLRVELGADSTKAEIDGDKATVRAYSLGLNYSF